MTKGHIQLWAVLSGIVLVSSMFAARQPARAVGFEIDIFAPEFVTNPNARAQFESELGFKFDGLKWYSDWVTPFDSQLASRLSQTGTSELSWEPVKNGAGIPHNDIANGTNDTYIRTYAKQVKSFNKPVRINLAPEMNGDWALWGFGKNGNTNETFIRFWRHVVDIFREEGATNAEWVWTPNIHYGGETYSSFGSYYPGDNYVDYMGLDGYNWGSTQGSGWQSFSEIFAPSYNDLTALSNKQILIMETGSAEAGGNKANWIRDMFTVLPRDFPRIIGLTWFHMNKETDWRINSSEASKQAFVAGVTSIRQVAIPSSAPTASSSSTTTIKPKPIPTQSSTPILATPTPIVTTTPTPDITTTPSYSRRDRSKRWYGLKRHIGLFAPEQAHANESSSEPITPTQIASWHAPVSGVRLIDLIILTSIVLIVESSEFVSQFRRKLRSK